MTKKNRNKTTTVDTFYFIIYYYSIFYTTFVVSISLVMSFKENYIDKIICGDCLDIMRTMPDNMVDLVITSPPYFQQRDYGNIDIGNENSINEYVNNLIADAQKLYGSKRFSHHSLAMYIKKQQSINNITQI
jgi:DNA modification methylase